MSKSVSTNVFKKKTGIQNIQAYLESGRSITPLEALSNFGIFRLATAINSLRKRGLPIETEMKKDPNGKTYARYVLGAAEAPKKELKVGARVRVKNYNPAIDGRVGVVVGITDCPHWPITTDLDCGRQGYLFAIHELEGI
jgi:hypothetical protein